MNKERERRNPFPSQINTFSSINISLTRRLTCRKRFFYVQDENCRWIRRSTERNETFCAVFCSVPQFSIRNVPSHKCEPMAKSDSLSNWKRTKMFFKTKRKNLHWQNHRCSSADRSDPLNCRMRWKNQWLNLWTDLALNCQHLKIRRKIRCDNSVDFHLEHALPTCENDIWNRRALLTDVGRNRNRCLTLTVRRWPETGREQFETDE